MHEIRLWIHCNGKCAHGVPCRYGWYRNDSIIHSSDEHEVRSPTCPGLSLAKQNGKIVPIFKYHIVKAYSGGWGVHFSTLS